MDMEDLVKVATSTEGCPYYSTRRSLPYLQLVLLPYNLILSKESREALGISLEVNEINKNFILNIETIY